MEKTIYQLKLHEYIWVSNIELTVVRVAGGWIYKNAGKSIGTFVPYHKEFMKDGDVVIPAFDENKEI